MYALILDELEGIFSSLQVKYMPIKGAYLICKGISSKLPYRKMTDIDILVSPEMLKPVSDFFCRQENIEVKKYFSNNYRQTESSFWYFSRSLQLGVCLEIHSCLNSPERFLMDTSQLFRDGIQISDYKYLPGPEDALLIFLCHLQSHLPFEFRETSMDEMALLMKDEGFCLARFWDHGSKTGLNRYLVFIFLLFNHTFKKNIALPIKSRYSRILYRICCQIDYQKIPLLFRRLLFDLPFVRNPVQLLIHKLST